MRREADRPAKWAATENQAAREMNSSDHGAKMRAYWHGSYSVADIYGHRIQFSPVASLDLTEAMPLNHLIERWITPLNRIVGLATSRRETISYLSVSTAPDQHRGLQVFGSGITQDPYAADGAELARAEPAFRCFGEGNPTLLDLCRAWQRAQDAHNPLIETFGAFLLLPRQHARPRYLLLIQALEGLHDHLHAAELANQLLDWKDRRASARQAVKGCGGLGEANTKFIRKAIPTRPISNLEKTLHGILGVLPAEGLVAQVEALSLVNQIVDDPAVDTKTWAGALRIVRNDLSHGSRGWDTSLLQPAADLLEKFCRAHLMLLLGIHSETVAAFLTKDWRPPR